MKSHIKRGLESGPSSVFIMRRRLYPYPRRKPQSLLRNFTSIKKSLTVQNEELQRTKAEVEAARAKYFELYDLAPVGYVTLTPELIIKESNLTASNMLGLDRKESLDKGLFSFVSPSSQDTLYLHYRRAAKGVEDRTDTVLVRRKDGSELQVQLKSRSGQGECRIRGSGQY